MVLGQRSSKVWGCWVTMNPTALTHPAGTGDGGPEDSTQQEQPAWDPEWTGSKPRLCDLGPLALQHHEEGSDQCLPNS